MINKVFIILGKALFSCAVGILGLYNDAEFILLYSNNNVLSNDTLHTESETHFFSNETSIKYF